MCRNSFCLQDFWATEASFSFIMVAFNRMSLFRYFGLLYGFAIGGWVSQHARKRVLKLSLFRQKRH
jgi:hypothetical protein